MQGEEEFVKASALKAAEKLIPEDFRAFNMSVLYEPDADALTEACETLPLFGDRRLVVCNGLASGLDYPKLADYIQKNAREFNSAHQYKKVRRIRKTVW